MFAPLRLAAVFQERRTQHPDPETVQRCSATEFGHFVAENVGPLARAPGAAVFGGPLRNRPAARRHALEPEALLFGLKLPAPSAPTKIRLTGDGPAHARGAIDFEPGAYLGAPVVKISHQSTPLGLLGLQ